MLAIRRATISGWNRGLHPGAIRISCAQFDAPSSSSENASALPQQKQFCSTDAPIPLGRTSSPASHRQLPWHAGAKGSIYGFLRQFSTSTGSTGDQEMPPEALAKNTVLSPDRTLGLYADLVTRVTNFQNEDKGLMILAGDVFDVPIRKDIVQRVVRWQLAKRQQGTHCTKTISEVSGTGRKPWKQKGTGRARHGTLRGPQFRHGATMHGPKPRSHAIKLQKKVRRLGLKIALSARTAEGKLLVFEDLAVPTHKTKHMVACLSQIDNAKKILLVDGGAIDENLKLATKNLHYVNILPSIGLNVYDILKHDTLVMTKEAVNNIVDRMHTPINR